MRTLFLNSPACHAPRAFLDQKTKRSDQLPFLVDHHRLTETETLQQQVTGSIQKNTEQNAHYLLRISTSGTQKGIKQAISGIQIILNKMLTICSHLLQ